MYEESKAVPTVSLLGLPDVTVCVELSLFTHLTIVPFQWLTRED